MCVRRGSELLDMLLVILLDFHRQGASVPFFEGHTNKKREPLPSLVRLVEAPRKRPALSWTSNEKMPHAYMYYTPIVHLGFRQGAVRACIYNTRRAYRCFVL